VDPAAVAAAVALAVEAVVLEAEAVVAEAAAVAAGGGGGGGGFGGGGFGNFRNFKPNQPHGAFFWTGGNSALNAILSHQSGKRSSSPATRQISLDSPLWVNPIFPTWSSTTPKT
jgi:hypothetical protein